MPWRQRRSALAAAPVGAAGIWQVWASDGPQYLQRPLPCGSAWMQAGQGPGSLRGAGRERRRLALDTPATLSSPRTWRGADAVRAQVRGVHASCRRVKGALDGAGHSSYVPRRIRPRGVRTTRRTFPTSALGAHVAKTCNLRLSP